MSDPFEDTPPTFTEGEEDPAADFLAREQDELAAIDDNTEFGVNGGEAGSEGQGTY